MRLVSFDIDGTMEFGDPPGPITIEVVHAARDAGWIVGSASDRTRRDQQLRWDERAVPVDFVSHKHHLVEVRARFEAVTCIHIGDTDVDQYYATQAGFRFFFDHESDDFIEAVLGTA